LVGCTWGTSRISLRYKPFQKNCTRLKEKTVAILERHKVKGGHGSVTVTIMTDGGFGDVTKKKDVCFGVGGGGCVGVGFGVGWGVLFGGWFWWGGGFQTTDSS